MKHPKYDLIVAAAAGEQMEYAHHLNRDIWNCTAQDTAIVMLATLGRSYTFRIKHKTIKIGDMEVPEPMRVAPEDGAEFWLVNSLNTFDSAHNDRLIWDKHTPLRWLKHGLCHATEEGARLHREALIKVSGGEA